MKTILKLLIVIGELIQRYLNKRVQVERDAEVEAIRNDPAGEFINEFGGVPGSAEQAGVSSDKARVAIDKH